MGAAGALAILLTVVGLQADRFGDIEITPVIHSSVQIEHARSTLLCGLVAMLAGIGTRFVAGPADALPVA